MHGIVPECLCRKKCSHGVQIKYWKALNLEQKILKNKNNVCSPEILVNINQVLYESSLDFFFFFLRFTINNQVDETLI